MVRTCLVAAVVLAAASPAGVAAQVATAIQPATTSTSTTTGDPTRPDSVDGLHSENARTVGDVGINGIAAPAQAPVSTPTPTADVDARGRVTSREDASVATSAAHRVDSGTPNPQ